MKYFKELLCFFLIGASIALISKGFYFWPALLIIFLIQFFLIPLFDTYKNDLKWISNALFEPENLERLKEERALHLTIQLAMNENKIKKGMKVEELQAVINGFGFTNNIMKLKFDYLLSKDEPLKERKIFVRGYGDGIPVPKITIKVKNGVLIRLERDNVFA